MIGRKGRPAGVSIDEPGCASLIDRRGMLARAVASENFPKVRQPKVRAVLLDKAVNPIPPIAATVGAGKG